MLILVAMLKNIHNVLSPKKTHKAAFCSPFDLNYMLTSFSCKSTFAGNQQSVGLEENRATSQLPTCCTFTPLFFVFIQSSLSKPLILPCRHCSMDGDEGDQHKREAVFAICSGA